MIQRTEVEVFRLAFGPMSPYKVGPMPPVATEERQGALWITLERNPLNVLDLSMMGSAGSGDAAEGVAAFLEKRRPVWRNE